MKKFIKKHKTKLLMIICALFGGTVVASAETIATIFSSSEVSYSNENMDATNVQDAIDELYSSISSAQDKTIAYFQLKSLVVTTGDGLYADSTESGRYIYRGASPSNYICLGDLSNDTCPSDSLYRIISIESDGTLKVIKNTSIGTVIWDPSYASSLTYNSLTITNASSVYGTRRQGTYDSSYFCKDTSTAAGNSYNGCKAWGSASSTLNSSGSTISTMPYTVGGTAYTLPTYNSWLNTYLNGGTYHKTSSTISITGWIDGSNGLNSTSKSKVLSTKTFNIGPVSYSSSFTLANNKTQEATYKWKGRVGLMNITDYVAASTNSECTNLYNYYYEVNTSCYSDSNTHNWLFLGSAEWTISLLTRATPTNGCSVRSSGDVGAADTYFAYAVRPVFYLSSSITLSGSGTSDSPYTISS